MYLYRAVGVSTNPGRCEAVYVGLVSGSIRQGFSGPAEHEDGHAIESERRYRCRNEADHIRTLCHLGEVPT